MKKCKTCFYSTACMAFEELNVKGDETACENYLDNGLVFVLPCPIGTIVYEKYKDCEHCPNYHEVAYSDYVNCDEDNELYSYSNLEQFHDDEKECLKHIKTKSVQFNIHMLDRVGKDIFMTKNVVFAEIPDDIYALHGHQYGKTIFNNLCGKIDYNEPISIVIPDHVKTIGNSFIHGFFEEIVEKVGIEYVINNVYIVSKINNAKNIIIESLM